MRMVANNATYGAELLPVKRAAVANGGVAIDSEVFSTRVEIACVTTSTSWHPRADATPCSPSVVLRVSWSRSRCSDEPERHSPCMLFARFERSHGSHAFR